MFNICSPIISVVMVSYRTGPVLFDAINAVLRQPTPLELIIVDNGNSATDLYEMQQIEKSYKNVKVITGHGNVGFGSGCNLGAKYAKARYLALINPDCILDENCLNNFLREAVTLEGSWIMGADLRNPDRSTQRGSRRAILTPWLLAVEALKLYKLAPRHPYFQRFNQHESEVPNSLTEVPAISGAYMIMPNEVYKEVGGMDESYFLHVEDLDFCLRHHLKGGKTYFSPNVKATHHQSSSQVSWFFVEYNKSISLCLYFEKHFEDFYPPVFMWFLQGVIFAKLGMQTISHYALAPLRKLKPKSHVKLPALIRA